MKNLIFAFALMMGFSSAAQDNSGEVHGYFIDKSTNEGIMDAHVFIKDQDRVYQVMTDDRGMFRISAVPAGTYTVNIRYLGDTMRITPVKIGLNSITQLGKIEIDFNETVMGGYVVTPGLRLIMGDLPILQVTSEEFKVSVAKFDPKAMIVGMSPEVRLTNNDELVFRGSRAGDMLYYVDGIKNTAVVPLPSASIKNMMIYTGALPAKYGDTMGGVIVVETKSYFDLLREYEGK